MRAVIAERHMEILTMLHGERGRPLRAKEIESQLDLSYGSVYEYIKRLKKRGWIIVSEGMVEEQTTPVPFYTISPLGVSAMRYGEAERDE